jgi:methyl-accepting chemotaxis protein
VEASLERCERDVEAARARLAADLQILSQPETVQSFTRAVKIELMSAKDAAIESAKSSASRTISDTVDALKSKAAANPAALLAIGAGVAWHVLRHPPIVTALVGAGLFSLLKTNAPTLPHNADFVAEGRERLKEQVGEFAQLAKSTAQSVSHAAAEQLSNATQAGVNAVSDAASTLTSQAQQQLREHVAKPAEHLAGQLSDAATRGADAVGEVIAAGRQMRHEVKSSLTNGTERAVKTAEGAIHSAGESFRTGGLAPSLVPDVPRQDTILLGIAGVAVAAALGFALNRSANEA